MNKVYATIVMVSELHHVPFMSEKEYLKILDNAVVEDYTQGANKLQSCGIELSDRYIHGSSICCKDCLDENRRNGLVEGMYSFAIEGGLSKLKKRELKRCLDKVGIQAYFGELQEESEYEIEEDLVLNNYKMVMSNIILGMNSFGIDFQINGNHQSDNSNLQQSS